VKENNMKGFNWTTLDTLAGVAINPFGATLLVLALLLAASSLSSATGLRIPRFTDGRICQIAAAPVPNATN
jgi:hypothetical protein